MSHRFVVILMTFAVHNAAAQEASTAECPDASGPSEAPPEGLALLQVSHHGTQPGPHLAKAQMELQPGPHVAKVNAALQHASDVHQGQKAPKEPPMVAPKVAQLAHEKPIKSPANAALQNAASVPTLADLQKAPTEAAKEDSKAQNPAQDNSTKESSSVSANTTANANATSNNAEPAEEKPKEDANGCATRKDPRAKAWFAVTSPEGTPCVFGVDGDPRDEKSHCIFDGGAFGSNGWCYTKTDRSAWGSCNAHCPLYGSTATIGKKIEKVQKVIDTVVKALNGSAASPAAAAENKPTNTASKAAAQKTPATKEAKDEKKTNF